MKQCRTISLLLMIAVAIFCCAKEVKIIGLVQTISSDSIVEPLSFANIAIRQVSDSSLVKGGVASDEGKFEISYTPKNSGACFLQISYVGIKSQNIQLNQNKEFINLGAITLTGAVELDEIVVKGDVRDVVQKGDTAIVNADAYRLPHGSYLEALVRRVPGLEYDSKSGALTYNGQHIAEINVNGEAFFSGNNNVALENLPADIVDKIKIYDKTSEIEKFIGIKTGEEHYVLDLQTKKQFNGTVIASGEVGVGNERKKLVDAMANYFRQNGENLSLIGRLDNRNLNTTYDGNLDGTAALNFMKKFARGPVLNGSINYNHNKMGNESSGYAEQYLVNDNRFQNSQSENISLSRNFSSLLGFRWEINPKTMVSASLSFNNSRTNSSSQSWQALFTENPGLNLKNPYEGFAETPMDIRINSIDMQNTNHNRQNRLSVKGELVRKLNESGSNIAVNVSHSSSNGRSRSLSLSSTTYYMLHDLLGNDSTLIRNQYNSSPSSGHQTNVGIAYTQPFNRLLNIQFGYEFGIDRNNDSRATYNLPTLLSDDYPMPFPPPVGEENLIDSLCNFSSSNIYTHEMSLRFNYITKPIKIEMSFTVTPNRRSISQKTGLMSVDTIVSSINFKPRFNFTWNNRPNRISFNYSGETVQPSLSDLVYLTDNHDPLNITHGNPNLKSTYRQSARLEYQNSKIGLTIQADGSNEYNSRARATLYNPETGGRVTSPVNVNGNFSGRLSARFQKRVRSWNFVANSRIGFNRNVSLLNEGLSASPERSITGTRQFTTGARISYNPSWGSVELMGEWQMRNSSNSLRQTNTYVQDYKFGSNIFANLPLGFYIKTDLMCNFRNGTFIEKGRDDQILWNLHISKAFLKNNSLEICASWHDILAQRKSMTINPTPYGYMENYTNQIGSFFLVTLKFRFNRQM